MLMIKDLLDNLEYINAIEGKRQIYYIYKGKKYYLILSFSSKKENAGNFTLVSSKSVDTVYRNFKNQKAVTSNDIFYSSQTKGFRKYINSPLDALNVLYILTVIGFATKDKRYKGKQLFFNIK
ncbi:MAG: hypothetical protein WC879_04430 [Melioribacteraceae bacterium]